MSATLRDLISPVVDGLIPVSVVLGGGGASVSLLFTPDDGDEEFLRDGVCAEVEISIAQEGDALVHAFARVDERGTLFFEDIEDEAGIVTLINAIKRKS